MKDIEQLLKNNKFKIDNLEVPEELETRLVKALDGKDLRKKSRINWIIKVAAILMIVMLGGYNFNTLAYYGKKIIGYDELMNSTLNKINEFGRGQSIEKSCSLKSGITITLDGVIFDDNQFIVFYTAKNIKEHIENIDITSEIVNKESNKVYNMKSSCGKLQDGKGEIKYIARFEIPNLNEKELDFIFRINGNEKNDEGEINFKVDPSKAMVHSLKQNIDSSVELDNTKVYFKSIVAAPTSTIIEGYFRNIFQLAIDKITGKRFRPIYLNIELIANGKEVSHQSSNISTNMKGIIFKQQYDALPKDLNELKIKIISVKCDYDVNKEVELNKNKKNLNLEILGQKVLVNKIYENSGDTFITISSEKHVLLTSVYLIIDGRKVELSDTFSRDESNSKKSIRTMHFKGTGSNLKLDINRITYEKNCNEVIDIPIKK